MIKIFKFKKILEAFSKITLKLALYELGVIVLTSSCQLKSCMFIKPNKRILLCRLGKNCIVQESLA